MRILMAWLFTVSPVRRASSRCGIRSSSSVPRMALRRKNAAPLGATIGSAADTPASGRARFRGSISNVRMRLGYRLLKSRTTTFV
jgi:hypothetical protein